MAVGSDRGVTRTEGGHPDRAISMSFQAASQCGPETISNRHSLQSTRCAANRTSLQNTTRAATRIHAPQNIHPSPSLPSHLHGTSNLLTLNSEHTELSSKSTRRPDTDMTNRAPGMPRKTTIPARFRPDSANNSAAHANHPEHEIQPSPSDGTSDAPPSSDCAQHACTPESS